MTSLNISNIILVFFVFFFNVNACNAYIVHVLLWFKL